MEVVHSLHQRQEVDALDSCGSLDRRNEPMEKGTELGTFGWRHLTEIQQMPPSLDDDRSCGGGLAAGRARRGSAHLRRCGHLGGGRPEALTPFSGRLAAGRCGSRTGDNTEADRSPQSLRCLRAPRGCEHRSPSFRFVCGSVRGGNAQVGVLSARQKRQERVEKLSWMLDVRDVPAFWDNDALGVGDVACGRLGEPDEVAESGEVVRLRVVGQAGRRDPPLRRSAVSEAQSGHTRSGRAAGRSSGR